jgi:SAM-dependent methyltransferase
MSDEVERHYAAPSRIDSLLANLDAMAPAGELKIADLAPLDQFHAGGLEATRQLATLAGLSAGQQVLDVGSGVGGPARFLAETYGCSVTGIDLAADYCRLAEVLTARVGLQGKATFRPANALDLPFADGTFDAVWTQHAAMNIADRPGLYCEMHRVLRPGGVVALYDAVAGNGVPLFPVPWARDSSTSFLLAPDDLRDVLQQAGFTVIAWRDVSEDAKRWFANRPRSALPGLGLHLLMGSDFPSMAANFGRSVMEGRVGLLMAVARKDHA